MIAHLLPPMSSYCTFCDCMQSRSGLAMGLEVGGFIGGHAFLHCQLRGDETFSRLFDQRGSPPGVAPSSLQYFGVEPNGEEDMRDIASSSLAGLAAGGLSGVLGDAVRGGLGRDSRIKGGGRLRCVASKVVRGSAAGAAIGLVLSLVDSSMVSRAWPRAGPASGPAH